MKVLALNCGSSSVKFQLFAVEAATREAGLTALGRGLVERIGSTATLAFTLEGRPPLRETAPIADHEAAVRRVIEWIVAGDRRAHV